MDHEWIYPLPCYGDGALAEITIFSQTEKFCGPVYVPSTRPLIHHLHLLIHHAH